MGTHAHVHQGTQGHTVKQVNNRVELGLCSYHTNQLLTIQLKPFSTGVFSLCS